MQRPATTALLFPIFSVLLVLSPPVQAGIVFPLPPLRSDPLATAQGRIEVLHTVPQSQVETSTMESTMAHDGVTHGGLTASYITRASGGFSPSVEAWAGAGNIPGSTTASGWAEGVAEVTYFFLIGSDSALDDPPEHVSILFNYELRSSGFEQHEYLSIGASTEARLQVIGPGGAIIHGDRIQRNGWVNINHVQFGHVALSVPFNEWIQVNLYARAFVSDHYGWTGLRHVGEATALVDPTVTIDPTFPNADLFQVHQVSVAPPVPEPAASMLLPFGWLALIRRRS